MLLIITVLFSTGILPFLTALFYLSRHSYKSNQIVLLHCLNPFSGSLSHPESLVWHYEVLLLPCQGIGGLSSLFPLPHPILCSSPMSFFHFPEYLLFHIFLPLAVLFLCIKCPSLPCPPCPSLPLKFSAPSSVYTEGRSRGRQRSGFSVADSGEL